MDMVAATTEDCEKYLRQHCGGSNHMKELARRSMEVMGTGVEEMEPDPEPYVPCQGISFQDESCGVLADYYDWFKIWLSWQSSNELRVHKYITTDEGHELRSGHCHGTCKPCPGTRNACDACRGLAYGEWLRRKLVECAAKKFGVELLRSRLFESEECTKELIGKWKGTVLAHRHERRLDKLIRWKNHQLQNWVRSSFLSMRKDKRNAVVQEYLSHHVNPVVNINVAAATDKKAGLIQAQDCFERFLRSPGHDELDRINVAIAGAALNGRLHGNPVLIGLVVSCLKLLQRSEDGKKMSGQNSKSDPICSPEAMALAKDAGATLALAGGSRGLLRQLGMTGVAAMSEDYEQRLAKNCLPVPFLALSRNGRLQENVTVIDQRLSSFTDTSGCYLSPSNCTRRFV